MFEDASCLFGGTTPGDNLTNLPSLPGVDPEFLKGGSFLLYFCHAATPQICQTTPILHCSLAKGGALE